MSDLIVLGVILFALNRLDKIDGESHERSRITEAIVEQSADARCCHRDCENISESINLVCADRIADDGEHPEHQAAVQIAPEKPQGRCSRDTGKS